MASNLYRLEVLHRPADSSVPTQLHNLFRSRWAERNIQTELAEDGTSVPHPVSLVIMFCSVHPPAGASSVSCADGNPIGGSLSPFRM